MANEVLIEFKADTTSLENALNVLESTGAVDKKTADQVRSSNKAWAERESTLKKVNEEQRKNNDPKNQPKPIPKEVGKSFTDLKASIGEIGKMIGVAFATQQIVDFAKESLK